MCLAPATSTARHLRRKTLAAACLAALVWTAAAPAAAQENWKQVALEKGVHVYVQPDDSRDLPIFRGVLVIHADILHLLAILTDVDKACDWNARCISARTLERRSQTDVTFYNRLDGMWPVNDRDGIYDARATILDGGAKVVASFKARPWPQIKVPSGTVRFTRLHGAYVLTRLGPTRTRVDYRIDADPGGWVPAWAVRYGSKWVPVGTLSGLRAQARRTVGKYDAVIAAWRGQTLP